MEDVKVVSVRVPRDLWRAIHMLKIDGKVPSLNAAVIDGLRLIVKQNKEKKGK